MTTLELIMNPPDLETLRSLFIVITPTQKDLIEAAQDPNSNMRVSPISLTDGRFAMCADILSEIHEGGMFYGAFRNLTLESVNDSEVITKEELELLLPVVIEEVEPVI